MLRLLIGTGLLLMALGFGAAGWQYWQTLPQAEAATATEAAPDNAPDNASGQADEVRPEARPVRQSWLIAPTGGLVAQSDVRAYLAQDRFVPERTVEVTLQAPLAALISEGEKLPEPTFLQVLADIRAPKIAEGLCNRMRQTIAADCAVNAARALEDSVDAAAGTARFRVELVYRMNEDSIELPDLAAHVPDGPRPSRSACRPVCRSGPRRCHRRHLWCLCSRRDRADLPSLAHCPGLDAWPAGHGGIRDRLAGALAEGHVRGPAA
jgi:hypothetical protein